MLDLPLVCMLLVVFTAWLGVAVRAYRQPVYALATPALPWMRAVAVRHGRGCLVIAWGQL